MSKDFNAFSFICSILVYREACQKCDASIPKELDAMLRFPRRSPINYSMKLTIRSMSIRPISLQQHSIHQNAT